MIKDMKTIKFSDNTEICSLGQGTWNMGRNPLKRKQETEALLTGIDLGMTMVDTAEMYANEEFVGKAIDGIRDKVFLVSKVLPENASVEGTIRACENSLCKLQTDRLDLYLLHWKGSHPFEDTIEAM
ncbi:MAG: aldo/keto reductase, partial [Muribaculaceae bacterium]|nr:aldo/keto reductase [Muribaculaceae bacterium]